jgi:hypothetical protein
MEASTSAYALAFDGASLRPRRRYGLYRIGDADKATASADQWLDNDFARRAPKVPPAEPVVLRVNNHDFLILAVGNAVIELDNHPQLMGSRPALQQRQIRYFKGKTNRSGPTHRLLPVQ